MIDSDTVAVDNGYLLPGHPLTTKMGNRIRTAIIADTHMSDGSVGDDFRANEYRLWKTADWLAEKQVSTIVFAGDALDFWEATPEQVWERYSRLILHLHSLFRVIYVAGNHDIPENIRKLDSFMPDKPIVRNEWFLFPPVNVNEDWPGVDVYPIWIIHGHIFDPIISKYPKLSSAVAKLGGYAERRGFPSIDRWFSKTMQKINQTGRNVNHDRFSDEALSCLEHWKTPIQPNTVICGHTHRTSITQKTVPDPQKVTRRLAYVNPGAWISERVHFLIADEEGVQLYSEPSTRWTRNPIMVSVIK